ncbi:cyclin-dependent kinase inhibitor 1C-like [Frieseomelitta varia]|uniref:cyclin-dependent kinase inhibitor 1C-like n=1 Tax=Frieseomelitta varia TaxID=561572 RepID=UPI001CB6A186|nr:cyclin-dependent kinase inhibitor 1C-like [Frieseomelitta varia]
MTMWRIFLFTLAVVAARPSHFTSLEGHGLASEPKLISESVHLKEIPTKIIKVTKTAVVKVPVPYPVKVPHHIPVPVPVNHPIAVPYTKLVKVQEHVPIEVSKPVPVAIHQQIPIPVPKAVPVPQPIPVPHPVTVNKPVFYPVPHPFPYQASSHSEGGIGVGGYDHGDHLSHQSENYSSYTVDQEGGHDHFQPSQPEYNSHR